MGRVMKYLMCLVLMSASVGAGAVELSAFQGRGLIDKVKLVVTDEVKGGCWTTANKVEQETRLKLEQSGIAVEDDLEIYAPNVARMDVLAYGKLSNGLCFGAYRVKVFRVGWEKRTEAGLNVIVMHFDKEGIAIGGTLSSTIESGVGGIVAEFAADVLKYRRDPEVIEARKMLKDYLW